MQIKQVYLREAVIAPSANFIKHFTTAICKFSQSATVFALGMPSPPSLMFVGNTSNLL